MSNISRKLRRNRSQPTPSSARAAIAARRAKVDAVQAVDLPMETEDAVALWAKAVTRHEERVAVSDLTRFSDEP